MANRPLVAGSFVLVLLSLSPLAAQESVEQWRRWEKTIQSGRDYTQGNGNPYRDLILRVRFTQQGTGTTFTQDAFWEASAAAPRSFKVRTALPPGSWSWQVAGCTGTTGGQSCAGDTWTPISGTITVNTNTSSNISIYDRGFLKQLQFNTPLGTGYSQLLYGDGTTSFYWAGDTVWAAPSREIGAQTSAWGAFLTDRKTKGFTTLLIAPSVAWVQRNLPAACGFSFNQSDGCTGQVIPNDSSKPRPEYWNAFDNLVQQANLQGFVVVVAGVMDPVDLGKNGTYPNLANAQDFARYLAARLAGNFVLYSPGFDDRVGDKTQDGLKTVKDVMNAVGSALKAAAPRHLVTNHLAGGSACTDYQAFQSSGWLTFHMFHSGHAFSVTATAATSDQCHGRLSSESREQSALRRARSLPLTLRSYTSPSLHNVNGEGPYDAYPATDPLDNRYRVRQAGHVSSLSNADGFTYGMNELVYWNSPGSWFGVASSTDMQRLATRFRNRAGLPARHEWILNQVAEPGHDKKMVLASDNSSLILAYLPGDSSKSEIIINVSSLPTLDCSSSIWTIRWFDPPTNNLINNTRPNSCVKTGNQISLLKPNCLASNPDCDLVLELQRTGAPSPSLFSNSLELWVDLSSVDGTSAIYGSLVNSDQKSEPVLISPSGISFQQSPRVARLAHGYFVVWHSEDLDGSLSGVFGQRLDWTGRLVARRMRINTETEHDQIDPAITADAAGNIVVVWSSYGQDGDLGGIFGQRFDSSGDPVGEEFIVNTFIEGNQRKPQIVSGSTGEFVVAWNTETEDVSGSAISFRRFDPAGNPRTNEIRIQGRGEDIPRLVSLEVYPAGEIEVRWVNQDLSGVVCGQFLQRFDITGRALGSEVMLTD